MSQRKTKSPENALFDGFSGIDTRLSHSGKAGSSDIMNFRIIDGGALQKRCGFLHYAKLGSNIRAVWTGILDGSEKCIVLCGNSVLLFDHETHTSASLGTVETASGKACFFYYRDRLYLADGNKIYELISPELSLSETIGYIPLIGKDWKTGKRGEIYEARNLLCDRGRISYKIEAYPTIYLHTGWLAKSVDAVYLNGSLLDPSSYTYNTIFKTVDLKGLNEGDEVLIYVTYASPEDEQITRGLFTCSAALNFGAVGGDRIFMWGGTKNNTLYCSDFVSRDSMNASLAADTKSSPLYFPIGYEFAAGDGRHAVRAAIRHYDRLLVFTEGDAWNANIGANGLEDIPLSSINTGAGCSSMCAVSMADNSPVSVGKRTVYTWNADTDEFNECNAKSISEAIDPLLSESFYENAIVFNAHKYGELWFHSKGDESTWIYNIKSGAWYRFTGFDASGFFELGGKIFFYDTTDFYSFDDTLTYDVNSEGKEKFITASFISHLLEFGTETYKRLDRLIIHADTNGGDLSIRIDADRISPTKLTFNGNNSHSLLNKRLHSGRFGYATLTVTSSDAALPTIHSAELKVR